MASCMQSALTLIPSGPFQISLGFLIQSDFDKNHLFQPEFHLVVFEIQELPSCTPRFAFPVAQDDPSYSKTSQGLMV